MTNTHSISILAMVLLVITSSMIVPSAIGQTKNATSQITDEIKTNTTNVSPNSTSKEIFKPSYNFTFKLVKEPANLSKAEQEEKEKMLEFIDPANEPINQTNQPDSILNTTGPKIGPESTIENETASNDGEPVKKIGFKPVGDADFRLTARSVSLPPGATNTLEVSPVTEPTVANGPRLNDGRQIVFYVGNFFAARSENGGRDWMYYNYESRVTPPSFKNAGDNDVIYSTAAGGKFIWYRQGEDGRYSIGISSDALTWTFYERYAKSVNLVLSALTQNQRDTLRAQGANTDPLNPWFDRPQLELSNGHLFINTRVVLGCNNSHSPNDPRICDRLNVSQGRCGDMCNEVIGSIIFRLNLDQIGQVIPGSNTPDIPAFGFFDRTVLGLVQGSTATMYWGALNGYNIRIYSWDDSGFNIQTRERSIRPFPMYAPDCSLTNVPNTNWCAEYTGSLYGWVKDDKIGFLWDASQGCLPATTCQSYQNHHCTPRENEVCAMWPYVDAATFNIREDFRYIERPSIWSPNYAVRYAYASPNVDGLAIMTWIGGGNRYPTLVASIDDTYQRYYYLHVLLDGAGTGGQTRWGDYLRVRPYAGDANSGIWIGSGYAYTSPTTKQVMFFIFGREIHTGSIQNLDLLLPNTLTIPKIMPSVYP